jgi:hypothetical protein
MEKESTVSEELRERQGYKVVTIPRGPRKGSKVLRVAWPERPELRAIYDAAELAVQAQRKLEVAKTKAADALIAFEAATSETTDELQDVLDAADTARAEADTAAKAANLAMWQKLADLMPEWDLKDRQGNPLPQPKDDPEQLDKIDQYTYDLLTPGQKDNIWADVLPNARS